MKKSIRYKTKLKYVEYVEICVLSSQQTSLKYFVSLEVFFFQSYQNQFFFQISMETTKQIKLHSAWKTFIVIS